LVLRYCCMTGMEKEDGMGLVFWRVVPFVIWISRIIISDDTRFPLCLYRSIEYLLGYVYQTHLYVSQLFS
jgi:hypothetical protein